MKTIKKIAILLMIMVTIVSGCKKNMNNSAQISQSDYEALEGEKNSLAEEKDQLIKELALYDEKYKTRTSFRSKTTVTAGTTEFNKVNDKIVLDGEVIDVYENQSNTATIKLSNSVSITPSKNWTVSISTGESNLATTNAYGTIKLYSYIGDFMMGGVTEQFIKPFLKKNRMEVQSIRDIFIGDSKRGEEAKARILIYDSTKTGNKVKIKAGSIFDETSLEQYELGKNADVVLTLPNLDKQIDGFLRVGLAKTATGILEYEFISENPQGDIIIDNLLTTIKVGASPLYLQ